MATTNDAMFTKLSALYPSGGQTLGDLLNTYWSSVLNRTNLVKQPNFESAFTGWTAAGSSTLSRVTSDFYVGTASMQMVISNTNTNSHGAGITPTTTYRIPCVKGDTFTASAYFKNTVGIRNWRINIRVFDSPTTTATLESNFGSSITNPTTWTRANHTYTVTSDSAAFVDMRVCISNAGSLGDTGLVDAVLMERGSLLLPYFDGTYAESETGYTPSAKVWNGTANLSTSTANYLTPAGTNTDYSYRGSEAYDYYKFEGATGETLGDLANDFWNNHTF